MPSCDVAALAAFGEFFERVVTCRLEQPIARFRTTDMCFDKRFCDQVPNAVNDA